MKLQLFACLKNAAIIYVKNNRKMMTDLISKSQKNADDLMNNKSQIKQRRNSALVNRAKILANKSYFY